MMRGYLLPLAIMSVGVAPAWSQEFVDCRECAEHAFSCEWPFSDSPDPDLPLQWYIPSVRACEAWNLGPMGPYSGAGVTAAIIDFGVWEDHDDLQTQYNSACSEDRPDPPPPCFQEFRHGTNMAGVFAAQAGNGMGGNGMGIVGVAPGARFGEIYLYKTPWNEQSLFEEMEDSLSLNNSCFEIKMMAYLLTSNQEYQTIPKSMYDVTLASAREAHEWLGVKYIIAGGNQADDADSDLDARTDYDELISSRHTISVGSVRLVDGFEERYATSRRGASLFCAAPGCDMWMTHAKLIDPDECTHETDYNCWSGTSFATPCVAGVVALMLEANPELAVRDVMEAIVQTAATIDPGPGWKTNQAGIDHSYEYGHGLIDAAEAVKFVTGESPYSTWEPLLGERRIDLPLSPSGVIVGPGEEIELVAEDVVANMRLEHVELLMNVSTTGALGIGPLEIEMDRMWEPEIGYDFGGGKPKLTRSVFAVARSDPAANYRNPDPESDGNVRFTSVRHWGEEGTATWKVRLRNTSVAGPDEVHATWNVAELRFFGTPRCIADWDMDGNVDQDDDTAYNATYNDPDPIVRQAADLDGSRDVTAFDLFLWDTVYYPAGCP